MLAGSNDEMGSTESQPVNSQYQSHHRRIPLHYIADIVSTSGPNTINREHDVQRKNSCFQRMCRSPESAVAELEKH